MKKLGLKFFLGFLFLGLIFSPHFFLNADSSNYTTRNVSFTGNNILIIPFTLNEIDYSSTFNYDGILYHEIFYYQNNSINSSDHAQIGFDDVNLLVHLWNGDDNQHEIIQIDYDNVEDINYLIFAVANVEGNRSMFVIYSHLYYEFDSSDFSLSSSYDLLIDIDSSSIPNGSMRCLIPTVSLLYPINNSDTIFNYVDSANQFFYTQYNQKKAIYDDSFNYYRFVYTPTNSVPNFVASTFSGFTQILNLELFPNVKIGYLLMIPFLFGAINLILFFWRKD